ncbi:hypothetical protein STAL104432_29905 [Streptomyces albus]
MGGGRGQRYHRGHPARQPHRRVHRRDAPRLRKPVRPRSRGVRGIPPHGQCGQHGRRPGRLLLRPGGAGGDGGHRVFVVAGGPAPGLPVAARRRVRPGAGRGCGGDGHAHLLRGVQPSAGAVRRRPVPFVRRRRGRYRLVGGGGCAGGGAVVGRRAVGPPGAGRGAGQRRQPGRRLQRPDRTQRPRTRTRHPRRTPQRPHSRRRSRPPRSTRHRHPPRRPHRSASTHQHLRHRPHPRPSFAPRLPQIQHRPHPGGSRCRRSDQSGAGHPAPDDAGQPLRRQPDGRGGLVGGHRAAAGAGAAVGGRRVSAPRRGLLLRHERDERPSDRGGVPPGPGARGAARGSAGLVRCRRAVGVVGEVAASPARTGLSSQPAPA